MLHSNSKYCHEASSPSIISHTPWNAKWPSSVLHIAVTCPLNSQSQSDSCIERVQIIHFTWFNLCQIAFRKFCQHKRRFYGLSLSPSVEHVSECGHCPCQSFCQTRSLTFRMISHEGQLFTSVRDKWTSSQSKTPKNIPSLFGSELWLVIWYNIVSIVTDPSDTPHNLKGEKKRLFYQRQ